MKVNHGLIAIGLGLTIILLVYPYYFTVTDEIIIYKNRSMEWGVPTRTLVIPIIILAVSLIVVGINFAIEHLRKIG